MIETGRMIRNIVGLVCTGAILVILGYLATFMIMSDEDPLSWITFIQRLLVLGPVVVILGAVLFISRLAEVVAPAARISSLSDGARVTFTIARVAGSVMASVMFVVAGSFTVLFWTPVIEQQLRVPVALLIGFVLIGLLVVQEVVVAAKRARLRARGILDVAEGKRTPGLIGLLLTAVACTTTIGTVVVFVHTI